MDEKGLQLSLKDQTRSWYYNHNFKTSISAQKSMCTSSIILATCCWTQYPSRRHLFLLNNFWLSHDQVSLTQAHMFHFLYAGAAWVGRFTKNGWKKSHTWNWIIQTTYGCWTKNRGKTPQNGWFIWKTLLKWMIWGYPYFWKHSYEQTHEHLQQTIDRSRISIQKTYYEMVICCGCV